MTHELFEKFTYSNGDSAWVADLPLPRLAALGVSQEPEPTEESEAEELAEIEKAMGNVKNMLLQKMREVHGPEAEQMFAALEAQSEKLPVVRLSDEYSSEGESEWDIRQRRFRQGLFPVRVEDVENQGTTSEQEAALRHLLENEENVSRVVMTALYDEYQERCSLQAQVKEYYERFPAFKLPVVDSIERLEIRLERVDIQREARNRAAYLVFHTDDNWDIEHGIFVVYHKDDGAFCTSGMGLVDFFEQFQPPRQETGSEKLSTEKLPDFRRSIEEWEEFVSRTVEELERVTDEASAREALTTIQLRIVNGRRYRSFIDEIVSVYGDQTPPRDVTELFQQFMAAEARLETEFTRLGCLRFPNLLSKIDELRAALDPE